MTIALMLAFAVALVPGQGAAGYAPPDWRVDETFDYWEYQIGNPLLSRRGLFGPRCSPPSDDLNALFRWEAVINGITHGIKRAVLALPDQPSPFAATTWTVAPRDSAVFGDVVGVPDTTSAAFVPPPQEPRRPAFDLHQPVVEDEHLLPCFRQFGLRLPPRTFPGGPPTIHF
jgi:hypothetical protein